MREQLLEYPFKRLPVLNELTSKMNHKIIIRLWLSSIAISSLILVYLVDAFNVVSCTPRSHVIKFPVLRSSIGDGDDGPPSNAGDYNRQGWDDFLNRKQNESDNLIRAREYISDNSLPLSYGQGDAAILNDVDESRSLDRSASTSNSSALVATDLQPSPFASGITQETLQRNPYLAVVTKLSPSEIISKFTSTAHPGVQNAVRSTILGLIGGLPKMAFETTTVTTGQKLASLMFQLQMTGYMFKNAEYRLSVRQSLDDQFLNSATVGGKVKGKLRVRYGGTGEIEADSAVGGELEMEVDAAAYMSELRSEVSKLRDELMVTRKEQDDVVRRDLLMYIRTLPPQELQSLTNTMSQDVLIAMKGLVNAVIAGIGDGQIGPDTITEQSGEAMAQLCMWQLALGYNLRTLEVREELRKALTSGSELSSGIDLQQSSLE